MMYPQLELRFRQYLICALACLVLLILLMGVFTPWWQTPDDALMYSLAHGVGGMVQATDHLVFINILWGRLISHIPDIAGVRGYTTATYGVMVISCLVMLYWLMRWGIGPWFSILTVTALFSYPFLNPQFTFTSGMAAAAGVIALYCYTEKGMIGGLATFMVMCSLSMLIRVGECALLVFCAIPLLISWKALKDWKLYATAAVLLAVLGGSLWMDNRAYEEDGWKEFKAFQKQRAILLDNNGVEFLKNVVTEDDGITKNDLDMQDYYLLVDRDLRNGEVWAKILEKHGKERPLIMHSLRDGVHSLLGLFIFLPDLYRRDRPIRGMALCMLGIFLLYPNRRIAVVFGVFSVLVFIIGTIRGSLALLRVFYPVQTMIIVGQIFFISRISFENIRWIRFCINLCKKYIKLISPKKMIVFFSVCLLFLVLGTNVKRVVYSKEFHYSLIKKTIADFKEISRDSRGEILFVRPDQKFEMLFAPFSRTEDQPDLPFYTLNWTINAPVARSHILEQGEESFFEKRFRSDDGVILVVEKEEDWRYPDRTGEGGNHALKLFKNYCEERFDGLFESEPLHRYSYLQTVRAICR